MCISRLGKAVNTPAIEKQNIPKKIIEPKNDNLKSEVSNKTNQKDTNEVKLKNGSSSQSLSFVDSSKSTDKTAKLSKGDSWENGTVVSTNAKGTTYKPADTKNIAMEGGVFDMAYDKNKGAKDPKYKAEHKIDDNTLDNFLADPKKTGFVAIALDKKLYSSKQVKYGDTFRIPEIEKKLGKSPIIFKAVDTGGHFSNKGFKALDIAVNVGSKFEHDPVTNSGKLTIVKIKK